jgi:hypothetical protein
MLTLYDKLSIGKKADGESITIRGIWCCDNPDYSEYPE